MTTHTNDLPSGVCVVCGQPDCAALRIPYNPNRPFVNQNHPAAQGPEMPPRPRRRGENRMRHLEADAAHHSSESEPS